MNRKMLVVDDDEVIVFALKDYFAKRGCDVDTARDHEQANALLTRQAYDLLIVDLHLGRTGVEGLDIIRALRACSTRSRVILLTAFGTPEVVCRAMQYGADRVLHKPVALPEVEQQVRALLEMTA